MSIDDIYEKAFFDQDGIWPNKEDDNFSEERDVFIYDNTMGDLEITELFGDLDDYTEQELLQMQRINKPLPEFKTYLWKI